MTDELTESEAEQILDRIVRNQLAIKELQEQNDALKLFFKERPETFSAGTTNQFGRYYIKVSSNERIDQALADRTLSEKEKQYTYRRVIDPRLARRYVPAAKLAKIIKKYDNRIEVGLIT